MSPIVAVAPAGQSSPSAAAGGNQNLLPPTVNKAFTNEARGSSYQDCHSVIPFVRGPAAARSLFEELGWS